MPEELLKGLSPELQTIASFLFVLLMVGFAAWSKVFGKREEIKPVVQEYAMTGQLADMKPVNKLIENSGLIVVELREATVAQRQAITAKKAETEAIHEAVKHIDALLIRLDGQNDRFQKIVELYGNELKRQHDEREFIERMRRFDEVEAERERERERNRPTRS